MRSSPQILYRLERQYGEKIKLLRILNLNLTGPPKVQSPIENCMIQIEEAIQAK